MVSLLVLVLLAQTQLDFADYLYRTGDYPRAALEYERIGMSALGERTLASYSLLMAGEALLAADEPGRAVRVYSFGLTNMPDEPRFAYGLLRAEFARGNLDAVDTLAALLEGTDLRWHSGVYRSFSLALAGKEEEAVRHLSLLGCELCDSAAALVSAPLGHRSPLFSAGLSTVLPGAGQAYCGRWGDAWQSLSVTGLFLGTSAYYLFFSTDTSTANTVKGVVTASLGGLFWLGNIYGALNAALDYNDYQKRKREVQLRNLLRRFELEPRIDRP